MGVAYAPVGGAGAADWRRRRRAGFTLLELMITVIVLFIIVLMVVPQLSTTRAGFRARSSAYTVLRLFRQAQSMAYRDGAAWFVRYNSTDANGHGSIVRYRGMTNRCRTTPWVTALGPTGCGPTLETLNMLYYNQNAATETVNATDSDRHVVQADVYVGTAGPLATLDFCYEPTGRVYTTGDGGGTFSLQAERILFEMKHTLNGVEQGGAQRRVVFDPGAQPVIHVGAR